MASLLITNFFKSVHPPESESLVINQTEQTSDPLVINQTEQTSDPLVINQTEQTSDPLIINQTEQTSDPLVINQTEQTSDPLIINQTEQTSDPLIINQTEQTSDPLIISQTTKDVTSRKRKRSKKLNKCHKRSKKFNGHTTVSALVESDGRVLLDDCSGVSSDLCEEIEESMVVKSDDSQVIYLSPLKHSPVIILGDSPKSNRSPRRTRSPKKSIKGRLLSFPSPAHTSHPTVTHVTQFKPSDIFWNQTISDLPQLGDTPVNYTPPCSGYSSLMSSEEKQESNHHHIIVSLIVQ